MKQVFISIIAICCCCLGVQGARRSAAGILRMAGVDAGLCVHLGCSDNLAAGLAAGGRLLVHSLGLDEKSVAITRKAIADQNLYGLASAETPITWSRLPYSDQTVNLLVCERLKELIAKGLTISEIWRVIAPGGSVYFVQNNTGTDDFISLVQRELEATGWGGSLTETAAKDAVLAKKLADPLTDEWTHWNYGPEGNAVSKDAVVKPPTNLIWSSGDESWGGLRNGHPGFRLSNGKALYNHITDNQELTVRDAFNGTLLWKSDKRSVRLRWAPYVFADDVIYTINPNSNCRDVDTTAPIVAIDAKTGNVLRTFSSIKGFPTKNDVRADDGEDFRNAEINLCDGKLIVSCGSKVWVVKPIGVKLSTQVVKFN